MKLLWIVLFAAISFSSCAGIGKGKTGSDIQGLWLLVGVECDLKGENCKSKKEKFVIEITGSGDILYDGKKVGTCHELDKRFTIIDGNYTTAVDIIYLDSTTMITRERGYDSTEKLLRLEK